MRRSRTLMTQVLAVNLLADRRSRRRRHARDEPELRAFGKPEAGLVLGLAVALTMIVNVYLLQRRFRPLEQLVDEMERADLSRPGREPREPRRSRRARGGRAPAQDVPPHARALETERRRASSAALSAQEEERTRIARDLHDEVNQSLTGLLLRLEAVREQAPYELAQEIDETKALANQAMQELLTLARQLRPTALDDLGLKAALAGNVSELDRRSAHGRLVPARTPRPTPTSPPMPSSSSIAWRRKRSRTPPSTLRRSRSRSASPAWTAPWS